MAGEGTGADSGEQSWSEETIEEQQEKQTKVQGKGVGLERRAGHNVFWVFTLFLSVYFISVCS